MTCRKRRDDVKTAGSRYCGISSGGACLRTERHPALRWPELAKRRLGGTWEPGAPMRTEKPKWKTHKGESSDTVPRGGTTRSSKEAPEKGVERRGCVREPDSVSQPVMGGAGE
jgi:hypothetical protein